MIKKVLALLVSVVMVFVVAVTPAFAMAKTGEYQNEDLTTIQPRNSYYYPVEIAAGVGFSSSVVFYGSKMHVSAQVKSSSIPAGVNLNVYLVHNGIKQYLFTMPTNGSMISTSNPVSIVNGDTYFFYIERSGGANLPGNLVIGIGASSY